MWNHQGRIEWRPRGGTLEGWRNNKLVAEVMGVAGTPTAWVRTNDGAMRTADPTRPWHASVDEAERACTIALR